MAPSDYRLLDALLGSVGLVLLSPLMAIAALMVKLEHPKLPVFFRHERVGRHHSRIGVTKFRTMVPDTGGSELTAAGDSRITRSGHLLRASKIDELPQLLNVIRGDMSLVGPRPESPYFVDRNKELFDDILRVRPGITDSASIVFRNEQELLEGQTDPESFYETEILPEKLALSRQGIEDRSLVTYVLTIAKTVRAIVN